MATARLLTPADYGVMGIAAVCLGFAQLIADVGLNATIIRAPRLSESLAARLGGAATMLGIAIAALVLGLAPLIAAFFREPRVRGILSVLSVILLLRGIQVLRRALLARALQFKTLALIEASEAVVAAVTACALAYAGAGYWSLVIGLVSGALVSTGACLWLYPHPVTFPRRVAQLEGALTFGFHVLGGQVAWYAYSSADMLIVGRVLGSSALGAYTFAWVVAGIAVERIAALTGKVTPAVFAAVQGDSAALRRYVYVLTEGLALITMPVCIGIALTADLIVPVVLGPAWTAAIAPMRILALYAAIRCVALLFPQVLVYTGHARKSMHYNVLALVVLVPLFILGASWGHTTGVAWAWLLAFPTLTTLTYARYLRRSIGLAVGPYLRALRPAAVATTAMAGMVIGTRALWPEGEPTMTQLMSVILLGAATYGAVVVTVFGERGAQLLRILRREETMAAPLETATVSTTPAAVAMPRRRILLICYHFPPDPAIGSLRWQKFSSYAAARGWGLDVIMRDEREIADADPERLADLPDDLRRFGVAERPFWFDGLERRAAALYRRVRPRKHREDSLRADHVTAPRSGRDLARAYFAVIAYLRMHRWAADAVRAARDVMQPGVHDVIIACGPPFSACVAGRQIARASGVPLVLDFRDPWSDPQRLPESTASPLALALNRHAERRAVAAAQLVVANSAPIGDQLRTRYPEARIAVIPNGYDIERLPTPAPRQRFLLAYAGTIYLDRNPGTLFAALRQVIEAQALTPDDIAIAFMGSVDSQGQGSLAELARAHGVDAFVTVHATRPRSAALRFLADASMLVVLSQDADMVIPGKLYEYMQFEAWLLALADPWSATARLLEGSGADVVASADVTAIARVIGERYAQFRAGARAVPIAVDERYSRSARAASFFTAVEQLLSSAQPRECSPTVAPRAVASAQ